MERGRDFEAKQVRLEGMRRLLERNQVDERDGGSSRRWPREWSGQTLAQLLKRPEITIEQLVPILRGIGCGVLSSERNGRESSRIRGWLSSEVRNELKSVETEIKYEGYLQQQQRAIDRLKKAEQRTIPGVVRLRLGERPFARDAGEAGEDPAAHHRAMRHAFRE